MQKYELYKAVTIDETFEQTIQESKIIQTDYCKTYILLFESLTDHTNGLMLIDAIPHLSFGDGIRYEEDSFKNNQYRSNYRVCSADEIQSITHDGEVNFCKDNNMLEMKRAIREKDANENLLEKFPSSKEIEHNILFLNKVIGRFINWFRNNGLPYQEIIEISGMPLGSSTEIIGIADQKKRTIEEAIKYINNQIPHLPSNYIKRDIVEICKDAYEKIIPMESKKKIINVSKYLEQIADHINHKFSTWTAEQFINYCRNRIETKQKR